MLVELKDGTVLKSESTFKSLKDVVDELVSQYGVGQIINAIDDCDEVLDSLEDEEIKLYMEGM